MPPSSLQPAAATASTQRTVARKKKRQSIARRRTHKLCHLLETGKGKRQKGKGKRQKVGGKRQKVEAYIEMAGDRPGGDVRRPPATAYSRVISGLPADTDSMIPSPRAITRPMTTQ